MSPALRYEGTSSQGAVSWGTLLVLRLDTTGNVSLTGRGMLEAGDVTANVLDLGARTLFVRTTGTITLPEIDDLASIITTGDITLIGSDIIFPASLTRLSAANLTLLATGRIGVGATPGALSAAFTFNADNALRLAGTLSSGAAITLTAPEAATATNMPLSITAVGITVQASMDAGT